MRRSGVGGPEAPEGVPVEARRVDWFELFFDLAFVAFITQLAHNLHGAPGPFEFVLFIAWSIPAWWAWTNIMVTINPLPVLPVRIVVPGLLVSMGIVGLMAASVTDSVDRAGIFSLACAALRLVLLVLWLNRTTRSDRAAIGRTFVYNGATAAIWIASAFTPIPLNFALWAVAILIEAALLRAGGAASSRSLLVDPAHASERLGLFMIVLMGESVLSLVTSLGGHWTGASGIAALVGFIAICSLAAGFFVFGINTMEQGLARLSGNHDFNGMLDTVMFLPYLLVIGVTMFAAGLSTAVAAPAEALPTGAAISLGGGVALFYLTNTIVSMRWGTPLRRLLRWAVPGVPLPLLSPLYASHVPAIVTLCVIAGIVLFIIAGSAVSRAHGLR